MPGCFPVSLGSQVPPPCYPHPKTCPFRAPSNLVLSWLLSLSLLVVESQDHCLPTPLLLLSEGVCLLSHFPLPRWCTSCQPFSLSPTPHCPTLTPPPAQWAPQSPLSLLGRGQPSQALPSSTSFPQGGGPVDLTDPMLHGWEGIMVRWRAHALFHALSVSPTQCLN